MSRLISDILQTDHVALHRQLQEYEYQSGKPSHDSRLISDIRVRAKKSVEDLGLDASNVAAKEVYFGLKEQARRHNTILSAKIGISEVMTPQEMVDRCVRWVDASLGANHVWTIKHSLVKSWLKKQPPKALMKQLGLKSVDSMLKRNNACELYTLAKEVEKPEWTTKFMQQLKKLSPSDFDARPVDMITVDSARIEKLRGSSFVATRTITPCYETGSIVIVRPEHRYHLDVLTTVVALLEVMSDMKKHSAYFRAISVRSDFPHQVTAVITRGLSRASAVIMKRNWNSVYRYMVGNEVVSLADEHPHLSDDDFSSDPTHVVLAALIPDFAFWSSTDYVFFVDKEGHHVSLHLLDVATNAANKQSFEDRYSGYGRTRLRDELEARYLAHPETMQTVLETFLYPEEV